MLLFIPLKSHRHPALRDSGLVSQRRFNDVSAILEGKDTNKWAKNQKKVDFFGFFERKYLRRSQSYKKLWKEIRFEWKICKKESNYLEVGEIIPIFAARKEPI